MTTVLEQLQARHVLTLIAALRGPSLAPPTAEEREQMRQAQARILESQRDLNGYRPLEWDSTQP
jgi:hypothetical protein